MTTLEFGEPFDSALSTVEQHLQAAELLAARAIYQQLLPLAEDPFLRAYLLANLGMVQVECADLAAGAASHDEAIALLNRIEPEDPLAQQFWLDLMLKALIGRADLCRKAGDLDSALAGLNEAAVLLPGFEGDGTRAAELGNTRASVLMSRGEWAAAEEIAALTLSTTDSTVSTVPYLLTNLGVICASTGRYDLAEDYLAQAGELLGDAPQLLGHRGFVALRRGEFEEAERLYTEASVLFEQRGQAADLAVCEQARGLLAALRGNAVRAADLMALSMAAFEQHGLAIAAADSALSASQQAYRRGDVHEMVRLAEQARGVYESRGVYERCAQTDFIMAASIEEGLARSAYGEHEAQAIDSALALAIPAALALEAMRCDFATGHARAQWLAFAEEAMRLAFRLAARRGDPGLIFELVEFRCAGVPLDRAVGVVGEPGGLPDPAARVADTAPGATELSGVAADIAATVGLRVTLPPKVLMSADSGRVALSEYIEAAEQRYRRRIVSEESVASW
ncbi:hypothetical protein [Kutzneria albida]|uniref:Uncharacterized protein n=1 Tax=Kutzneria albida DSM 43870 TaxID=1449976 RepID=W5W9M7_9PSEU|nr:hypothetical protein [Kutzneria albida]AHH97236.1 hypothetical protein KALB_3872 [Kutzneria albida DSM 43870]